MSLEGGFMAQGRILMRDLWASKEFFDKPYWVHTLVTGMIVYADDEGRITADLEWLRRRFLSRSRSIRGPNVQSLRTALAALVQSSMLSVCKLDGVSHYKFNNWSSYQKLRNSKKRSESEAEAEDEDESSSPKPPSRTKRSLTKEEWSFWVERWNISAAAVGVPQISPRHTARAQKARERIFSYLDGRDHLELLNEICVELELSGRQLRGRGWFSLPWLFERGGENLEKFLGGNYRDLGVSEPERRQQRSDAETIALVNALYGDETDAVATPSEAERRQADVVIEGEAVQVEPPRRGDVR